MDDRSAALFSSSNLFGQAGEIRRQDGGKQFDHNLFRESPCPVSVSAVSNQDTGNALTELAQPIAVQPVRESHLRGFTARLLEEIFYVAETE
jgi:hypothetical protein